MMFGWFDPLYLILIGPTILLALWTQWKVKSTFEKYSSVRSRSGVRGADAAAAVMRAAEVEGVTIERAHGYLTDHYNPWKKTLNLSEPVYDSDSIAALGVAAHEAGHAIQHKGKYFPLVIRSAWVPVASIGSSLAPIVILIGAIMASSARATGGGIGQSIVYIGIWLYAAFTAFTLITLPVEFNASARARAILKESGIVSTPQEEAGVKAVLWAAGMTYVAAAASAIMTLIYFILRYGGGNRNRD